MRAKSILMGIFGLGAALVVHVAILLFGGWFFLKEEGPPKSTIPVELIDPTMDDDKKKEDPQKPQEPQEEVQKQDETPPDTSEVVDRASDVPATDLQPELDATTIAGLANALGGGVGGGEFFDGATSLEGGGIIGGTGRRGGEEGGDPLDEAFDPAGIDQQARVLVQTAPSYPSEMRGKKVEGVVTLIFVVDENGKVDAPKVESSSHKAFETPALSAVRKWKFEPGMRGGERVASKKRITIRFPAA
jgi:protein TonB